MKHKLTMIACSGLIALGFAVTGSPAYAGAGGLSSAGFAAASATDAPVVKVHSERRKWRQYRKHRRHGHRNWRRSRPNLGFYFEFGRPAPRYYARPRAINPYYRPRVSRSRAHVNWCFNRYRSYRAWDDSFQPYNGPRRRCISPYRR